MKFYLTRKDVLNLIGGRAQLRHLEREQRLRRYYPAGLKHARYLAREVKLVIDSPARPSSGVQ